MFKPDKTARFTSRQTFFTSATRFTFEAGRLRHGAFESSHQFRSQEWTSDEHASLHVAQSTRPVRLMQFESRAWWWFRDVFYVEDEQLTADQVADLAIAHTLKHKNRLDRAATLAAIAERLANPVETSQDRTISPEVKIAVWRRDQGQCVECASQERLEFDHIIPFSLGGSNTERNIQLLCETCNRAKGAHLGFGKKRPAADACGDFIEFDCVNQTCGQRLRLPVGKGSVQVRCPSCMTTFSKTT